MKNQLFQLFVFFFVIFATHEISFALPIDPALPSGEYASSSLIIKTRAHCDMVDTVTKKRTFVHWGKCSPGEKGRIIKPTDCVRINNSTGEEKVVHKGPCTQAELSGSR